jgi:hypothetical protein
MTDFNRLVERLSVELASIKRQITQGRGKPTREAQEAIVSFDSALNHVKAELAAAETERAAAEAERGNQLRNDSLSPAQERRYKKLKSEIVAEVKSLQLNHLQPLPFFNRLPTRLPKKGLVSPGLKNGFSQT